MTSWRITAALMASIIIGWRFNKHVFSEESHPLPRPGSKDNPILFEPFFLPILLFVVFVALTIKSGLSFAATTMGMGCLGLFFQIGIYHLLLLALLPLLRSKVSAQACAELWLLPNLLCFVLIYTGAAAPLITITLPFAWVQALGWIWLCGFLGIMLRQRASHFLYRRRLLKSAKPLMMDEVHALWRRERQRHGVRRDIPILVSKKTASPVTIGCFESFMRLILPTTEYTPEELTLIFRHELGHVQGGDSRKKFLISLYTALCWFNPLAWQAQRRALEDLERSCDERVLADEGSQTRDLYAELVLKSAHRCEGYSTCPSSTANSLRFRLENVMHPRKGLIGGFVIGLALFSLVMGAGRVSFADSMKTVSQAVFDKVPLHNTIDSVNTYNLTDDHRGYSPVYGWDEGAITEYVASLGVKEVYSGNYPKDDSPSFYVNYGKFVDGVCVSLTSLRFSDGLVFANIPLDGYGERTFILEDEIDWDYVESLLDFNAENPDPPPQPPTMMLYFNEEANPKKEPIYASRKILSQTRAGELEETSGALDDAGVGGLFGFAVKQAELRFSYAPTNGYKVKVENWDRTKSYTVTSEDLVENRLPLAPYSAHYTLSGSFFTARDTIYEVEFYFDVKLPEE